MTVIHEKVEARKTETVGELSKVLRITDILIFYCGCQTDINALARHTYGCYQSGLWLKYADSFNVCDHLLSQICKAIACQLIAIPSNSINLFSHFLFIQYI